MNEIQRMTYILEGNGPCYPLDECIALAREIDPQIDINLIIQIDNDTADIFNGLFPGVRGSNLTYHNLRHTHLVALAVARLFHGLWCDGRIFSTETLIQGLLSAYFHDTGMLLTDNDSAETPAQYVIKGHEERSITFLHQYIQRSGMPAVYAKNCAAIIRCTDLHQPPHSLQFPTEEIELAGHVVGTADILAQMADRYYLEQLPLLFQEQQECEAHHYATSLELMQHTVDFYQTTVHHRLKIDFADAVQSMQSHFRERWHIDRNLYAESILKNITYLESIIARCTAEQECYKQHLRRIPPLQP